MSHARTLTHSLTHAYPPCRYTEAISLLEEAIKNGKQFENPVFWGVDMASEHERYITEEIFKQPTIVYNYPKDIKVGALDIHAACSFFFPPFFICFLGLFVFSVVFRLLHRTDSADTLVADRMQRATLRTNHAPGNFCFRLKVGGRALIVPGNDAGCGLA